MFANSTQIHNPCKEKSKIGIGGVRNNVVIRALPAVNALMAAIL